VAHRLVFRHGVGDFHRHRRLAGAIALVGALLYTALVPGHVVSQATTRALAAEDGSHAAAFEPVCHSGVAGKHAPAPGEPSAPHKKCPFCSGYAAFMTALAGDCFAGALDAERASPNFTVFDEGIVETASARPNNRGSPLEL
jgi:hypothetical protein